MISEIVLTYIIIMVLINFFGSKLIPQLLVLTLIIYTIYNYVIVAFEPLDVILFAVTVLYCISHMVDSIESKEDD